MLLRSAFLTPAKKSYTLSPIEVLNLPKVPPLCKKTYRVHAKKIVNAAGPWVDRLREKDHSKEGKHLQHTKGVHLVFDANTMRPSGVSK